VGHCWAGDGVVGLNGRKYIELGAWGSRTMKTGARRVMDLDIKIKGVNNTYMLQSARRVSQCVQLLYPGILWLQGLRLSLKSLPGRPPILQVGLLACGNPPKHQLCRPSDRRYLARRGTYYFRSWRQDSLVPAESPPQIILHSTEYSDCYETALAGGQRPEG